MNRYHLEIINGVQLPYSVVIEAYELDWSEAGNYKFYNRVPKLDRGHRLELIALYPIKNTIVSKIEYNIEP